MALSASARRTSSGLMTPRSSRSRASFRIDSAATTDCSALIRPARASSTRKYAWLTSNSTAWTDRWYWSLAISTLRTDCPCLATWRPNW